MVPGTVFTLGIAIDALTLLGTKVRFEDENGQVIYRAPNAQQWPRRSTINGKDYIIGTPKGNFRRPGPPPTAHNYVGLLELGPNHGLQTLTVETPLLNGAEVVLVELHPKKATTFRKGILQTI